MFLLFPIFNPFHSLFTRWIYVVNQKELSRCISCSDHTFKFYQFPSQDSLPDIFWPTLLHDSKTWRLAVFHLESASNLTKTFLKTEHIFFVWQRWCGQTPPAPHLVAAGSEEFSKGLDGTGLVVLYQLRQTCVGLVVSRYDKPSLLVLGNDKMATPVVTPSEGEAQSQEIRSDEEAKKEPAKRRVDCVLLVRQDESDGLVTEPNEETAQVFISQQIFRVPGAQKQTHTLVLICCNKWSEMHQRIWMLLTFSSKTDSISIDSISNFSLQVKRREHLSKVPELCVYKELKILTEAKSYFTKAYWGTSIFWKQEQVNISNLKFSLLFVVMVYTV